MVNMTEANDSTNNISTSEYSPIFETARQKIKGLEESKRQVILDTAKKLEESRMPKEMISSEMARELEGYTTPRYIQECLGEEHKRKRTSSQVEDKKQLVQVTTTGEQQEPRIKLDPEKVDPNAKVYLPTNIFANDNVEIEIGQRTTTDWIKVTLDSPQWEKMWRTKTIGHNYFYLRINGPNLEIKRANE